MKRSRAAVWAGLAFLAVLWAVRSGVPRSPAPTPRPAPETATPAATPGAVAHGSLGIRFTDPDGLPAAGVQVELEPATGGRRSSDAGGRVEWAELPPGGRRWVLASPHRVHLDPRWREPLYEIDPRTPVHPAGPRRSEPFDVPAGTKVELAAVVVRPGSLRGTVERPHADAVEGSVLLSHQTSMKGPPRGPAIVHGYDREGVGLIDSEGGFHFPEVQPGTKRVELCWRDRAGIHFAEAELRVFPGAETYLGPVRGDAGESVRGMVRALGRECLPADQRNAPIPVLLAITSRPTGPESRNYFSRTFPVLADEPFVLHGLCRGKLWGSARVPWKDPAIRWRSGSFSIEEVPTVAEFETRVAAEALVEARLRVRFGAGLQPGPVDFFLRPDPDTALAEAEEADAAIHDPLEGNPRGSLDEVPTLILKHREPVGDVVETIVALRPGPQIVWAFAVMDRRSGEGQNGFGEALPRIESAGRHEIEILLSPGATLRGRLLRRSGAPFQTNLALRMEPFAGAHDPFLREVVSDELGRFVMRGIPPGRVPNLWRVDRAVPPLVAGTETVLDLVLGQ